LRGYGQKELKKPSNETTGKKIILLRHTLTSNKTNYQVDHDHPEPVEEDDEEDLRARGLIEEVEGENGDGDEDVLSRLGALSRRSSRLGRLFPLGAGGAAGLTLFQIRQDSMMTMRMTTLSLLRKTMRRICVRADLSRRLRVRMGINETTGKKIILLRHTLTSNKTNYQVDQSPITSSSP
jgi:hypothetical protein